MKIAIRENFTKIYGTNDNGVKCYKTCCDVVLYGAGLENSGLSMGGISLSIDTKIAIITNQRKKFRIVFSDMNTQYECDTEKLKDFMGDKLLKSMFKSCAMIRGDIDGADILIEYSIDDKRFKKPAIALISALGILNNGKIADIETVRCLIDTDEELYSFLPATLYGRKNVLVSREENHKLEYLPFDLNGLKIVLSLSDDKGFDIKKILSKPLEELKNDNTFSESNDKLKNYITSELNRARLIKEELTSNGTITPSLSQHLKSSAYELLDALGKSADKLLEMYRISERTGLTKALVPMYSHFGVCAFVEDENVDKYIEIISREYQKKVGTIPTLCICDSGDSCVEITH